MSCYICYKLFHKVAKDTTPLFGQVITTTYIFMNIKTNFDKSLFSEKCQDSSPKMFRNQVPRILTFCISGLPLQFYSGSWEPPLLKTCQSSPTHIYLIVPSLTLICSTIHCQLDNNLHIKCECQLGIKSYFVWMLYILNA